MDNIFEYGFKHGKNAVSAIINNLDNFFACAKEHGLEYHSFIDMALKNKTRLLDSTLREISGIAAGSNASFSELLCYNLYHSAIIQEGCTVYFAAGNASNSGATIFGKNCDKIGGLHLTGDLFFKNKEINVILVSKNDDGSTAVGVAAAGATGMKMGINTKGVVSGTNIARTQELKDKKLDLTKLMAADRQQISRNALTKGSALEAAQMASCFLMANPTATPGTVEFGDANEVIVVESSYDRMAVKKITDEADSRSNCFITLNELNQMDDISSIARYYRSQHMLKEKEGRLTADDLIAISMDHANGPGICSICRHDSRPEEETSISAAVMEICRDNPEKSIIHIALGKPCHAWRASDGHISIAMDSDFNEIPLGFLNGDVFKKYYTENPYTPANSDL